MVGPAPVRPTIRAHFLSDWAVDKWFGGMVAGAEGGFMKPNQLPPELGIRTLHRRRRPRGRGFAQHLARSPVPDPSPRVADPYGCHDDGAHRGGGGPVGPAERRARDRGDRAAAARGGRRDGGAAAVRHRASATGPPTGPAGDPGDPTAAGLGRAGRDPGALLAGGRARSSTMLDLVKAGDWLLRLRFTNRRQLVAYVQASSSRGMPTGPRGRRIWSGNGSTPRASRGSGCAWSSPGCPPRTATPRSAGAPSRPRSTWSTGSSGS